MFKAATENVSLKGMLHLNFLSIFSLFFSFLGIASLNYGENLKKILQKEFFFIKSYRFLLPCNNYLVNCLTGISDQVYSNTRVPTQVNTNQHESTQVSTSPTRVNTNQHESNTSQHKFDTSQHESTRV